MIKLETPQDKRNYWFKRLIDFVKNSKYEPSEKEILIKKIASYYLNEKRYNYKWLPFEEEDKTNSFFAYLNSISKSITFSSFDESIELSANNQKGDFIASFIRSVVIDNIENINYKCNLSDKTPQIGIKATLCLGEYPLAHLELYEGNDVVMFAGVEVNKNTRRLGLGTMLFKAVMTNVHEVYPGKDLIAHTVFKDNIEAIEFYKSLGATMEESIFSHCYSTRIKAENIEKVYKSKNILSK